MVCAPSLLIPRTDHGMAAKFPARAAITLYVLFKGGLREFKEPGPDHAPLVPEVGDLVVVE